MQTLSLFIFYTPFNGEVNVERSVMVFHRVYLNVVDNQYYVEDIGTAFDDFWTSLNTNGVIGRFLYRLIFDIVVNVSRITGKCKTVSITFD